MLFQHSFAPLREKCPNTEFFQVRIFLYSVRIHENTDQEKPPCLDTFQVVLYLRSKG